MRFIPPFALLLACLAAEEAPRPAFDASGAIRFADKSLTMAKGHLLYTVDGKELMNLYPFWSAPGQSYGEAGYGDTQTVNGLDAAAGEWVVAATLPKAGDAKYEIRVGVLPDGLVRYRVRFTELGDLKNKALQVRFPKSTLDGTTIRDEGQDLTVAPFDGERKSFLLPKGHRPEFFAENPDRAIGISLLKHDERQTRYGISDARHDKGLPRMEYRPGFNAENEIELTLDLRKLSDARRSRLGKEKGDAWDVLGLGKFNRMELPNFAHCSNLIQNPGFEEGFHGWELVGATRVTNLDHLRDWLLIDDRVAFQGKRSLRFELRPSYQTNFNTTLSLVAPYAFQLKVGKKYTLSFYAKAETDGLSVGTVAWGAKTWGKWLGATRVKLTRDWKRFTVSFAPTETLTTVMFGVPWWFDETYQGVRETTHFWADAFQLEEGEAATEFTVKPVSILADGLKACYGLREEKPIALQLVNNRDAECTVNAVVSVRDFFKNEVAAKVFQGVKLPPGARVPLAFTPGKELAAIGYYTVRVGVESGGQQDRDFFPFTVIDPYSKEELAAMKHRLFFTWGNTPGGDRERNVRRLRELGVGGLQPQMYPMDEGSYRLIANEGILQFTGLFGSDANNMYIADPAERALVAPLWHLKRFEGPAYEAYTNFLRDTWIPRYRHYPYIKFFNEPHLTFAEGVDAFGPSNMAKLYRDLAPILRAGIPGVKLISSDPANIGDQARRWHEQVFAAGGGKVLDILAGHPYREKPERPDLDADIRAFIDLADRLEFKGELWFTEAGNHPMLQLPGFGAVEPRHSALTGDLPGRRGLIAYNIRYLLMTLKYADRIRMFLNWKVGIALNALDGTPSPVGVEYNAVARAFGNSRYVRDFAYADGVKTLLFDDGGGRGVAAIWDFEDRLEAGERKPNRFRLHAKGGATAADLFGRPLRHATREGDDLYFDLEEVPAILRAPDVKTLAEALEKSGVQYGAAEQVAVAVGLSGFTTLKLDFKNRGATAFTGTASVKVDGKPKELSLALRPFGEQSVPVRGDGDSARYSLATPIRLVDAQGKLVSESGERRYHALFCNRRKGPIAIDGDLSDWAGYRSGLVGKDAFDVVEYQKGARAGFQDLGARFWAAWDESALYLAVEVSDDTHTQAKTGGGTWDGDSVQVFIDAFRDGQETSLAMQDDYAYAFAKTPLGDQVWRAFSPDRQLSWLDIQNNTLEPGVEAKIIRDDAKKVTRYELRFPAKYIQPVALKQGNVIGLGLMVNDADGGGRKTAITTCDGKEGWMKPYNLSFFYFE